MIFLRLSILTFTFRLEEALSWHLPTVERSMMNRFRKSSRVVGALTTPEWQPNHPVTALASGRASASGVGQAGLIRRPFVLGLSEAA